MIKHFIELIIQAINKMIGNAKVDNSIDSSISDDEVYIIMEENV